MTRFDQPANSVENSFAAMACVEAAKAATTANEFFGLKRAAMAAMDGTFSSEASDAYDALKTPHSFPEGTHDDLVSLAVNAAVAPFMDHTFEIHYDALWHCAIEDMDIIDDAISFLSQPDVLNLTDRERERATEILLNVIRDYMEMGD